jgi:hypothetical protein
MLYYSLLPPYQSIRRNFFFDFSPEHKAHATPGAIFALFFRNYPPSNFLSSIFPVHLDASSSLKEQSAWSSHQGLEQIPRRIEEAEFRCLFLGGVRSGVEGWGGVAAWGAVSGLGARRPLPGWLGSGAAGWGVAAWSGVRPGAASGGSRYSRAVAPGGGCIAMGASLTGWGIDAGGDKWWGTARVIRGSMGKYFVARVFLIGVQHNIRPKPWDGGSTMFVLSHGVVLLLKCCQLGRVLIKMLYSIEKCYGNNNKIWSEAHIS